MDPDLREMRERFLKVASASIYDALDALGYPAQDDSYSSPGDAVIRRFILASLTPVAK